MANWKKMAEAFGRAVRRPDASKKGTEMVWDSKTVKDRLGDLEPNGYGDPEGEAFKRGVRDADEVELDYSALSKSSRTPETRKRMFESADEVHTEDALQDDFDKAFEEAMTKRGDKIRAGYKLEGHEDLSDEANDNAIDKIRRTAIEMLKKGEDIGDVLRILEGK